MKGIILAGLTGEAPAPSLLDDGGRPETTHKES